MKSVFVFLFCAFAIHCFTTPAYAKTACHWNNKYNKGYWRTRSALGTPEGLLRSKLSEHSRYQTLKNLRNSGTSEKAELASLEAGESDRCAELRGKAIRTRLSPPETAELAALEATNGNVEAGNIARKFFSATALEKARYAALVATKGDFRAAYLAEVKFRGHLKSPAEIAELEALLLTKGDRHYASLKSRQAEKKGLDECEQAELTYIEGELAKKTNNLEQMAFDQNSENTK
jgi:hypothetical protein